MTPDNPPQQLIVVSRRSSCATALVLIVLILAALAAFLYYRAESFPMRTAQQARDIFAEVLHLQPKISVSNQVVFQQATGVLELAVVSRETQVNRETEEQWLGSTKRLTIRGVYRVRSGFDLTKPFEVRVEGRTIRVEVPPPKVLSVDQVDARVLNSNNGLWNKISPTDMAAAFRELPTEALRQAKEQGINREALDFLRRELQTRFGKEYEVEVVVRESPLVPRDHAGG